MGNSHTHCVDINLYVGNTPKPAVCLLFLLSPLPLTTVGITVSNHPLHPTNWHIVNREVSTQAIESLRIMVAKSMA